MQTAEIDRYWEKKVARLRTDPSATMKDVILRSLEIEAIGTRLQRDDKLLDVGTGNAYGALRWAEQCRSVLATDASSKMVETALEAIGNSSLNNIRAEQANVLNLSRYAGQFTAVSSVRCLINLTTTSDQLRGIEQLAAAVASEGRLFLIEGLSETFEAMNRSRLKMGLPPIALNWHNTLLGRNELESALEENFSIQEVVDFGEYYFLSRIIHPLLVEPDEPVFDGRLNVIARDVWRSGIARGSFASMSTLMLYVCRRNRR
jgi:protein-L-isoaspartate O-methyltransferase